MSRKKWTNEKLFYRILNNKSDHTYNENIRELRGRGGKDIFKKSVALLHAESAEERCIGANILSQLGKPPRVYAKRIIKLFCVALKNETDAHVINAILFGIGHNNNHLTQKQTDFICSFRHSTDLKVRQALVFALQGLIYPSAIDTMIMFSRDKNNWIRNWATFGLGSNLFHDTEEIRVALWERVSDKYIYVRKEAIFGLAQLKDPGIKQILKDELKKMDTHSSIILEAIEVFEDKDFIPLLEQQIMDNKKSMTVNEDWLVNSLNKLTTS